MAPYHAGLDSIAAVLCYSIQNDRKIRRSEPCSSQLVYLHHQGTTGEILENEGAYLDLQYDLSRSVLVSLNMEFVEGIVIKPRA